jgi:hypothetical protein
MEEQSSTDARNDYDSLLQALLPFAEQMLKEHGEFYPFGMAINGEGAVVAHAIQGEQEMPDPREIVAKLVSGLKAEASAGKIRAAGICSNGRIELHGKATDAIIATLECIGGEACRACVPYKKKFLGGYSLGDVIAGKAESRIFV